MNIKIKLLVLLGLALLGAHVPAQTVLSQADAQANEANRELLLRGGKMSPRQQAEWHRAEQAEQAGPNLQASAGFLAANKIRAGVITLPSGVQYKVLKAGAGKRPTQTDAVRCRYQGTLADGTRFDSVDDKTPAVLKVAGLLPGLQEALTRMPAGSKWEVVVPPEWGYGAKGYHGVGPNAVLVYVIELVGIV